MGILWTHKWGSLWKLAHVHIAPFAELHVADCCLSSSDYDGERTLTITLPRLAHAVLPQSAFAARLLGDPGALR